MTIQTRRRVVELLRQLPGAVMLAVLTGSVTIVLALVVSLVLGAESRELYRQSVFNGEEVVDHAIVSRCEMAHIAGMLRIIGEQTTNEDLRAALADYPIINTEGLDCDSIITEPFRIGNDFGLEGPEQTPEETP